MDYIAVAFRSREQTLKFASYLNKNGLTVSIVNTPKEAGVGCGLSVKIPSTALPIVKRVLSSVNVPTFAGCFSVTERGNRRIVRNV